MLYVHEHVATIYCTSSYVGDRTRGARDHGIGVQLSFLFVAGCAR
jgi:hypothetical protein